MEKIKSFFRNLIRLLLLSSVLYAVWVLFDLGFLEVIDGEGITGFCVNSPSKKEDCIYSLQINY